MRTINKLLRDVGFFINHLFSPDTFAIVTALGGFGWKAWATMKKKTEEERKQWFSAVGKQISGIDLKITEMQDHNTKAYYDLQKEILRLQLLEGMDAKRLSPSETQYFYDKYKAMGGNSFVTAKVEDYLIEYEEEHNQ